MATLLYSLGADRQTLKSLLGHSKITTTMDTYAHPVSAVQRAEIDRLGELLGGQGQHWDDPSVDRPAQPVPDVSSAE